MTSIDPLKNLDELIAEVHGARTGLGGRARIEKELAYNHLDVLRAVIPEYAKKLPDGESYRTETALKRIAEIERIIKAGRPVLMSDMVKVNREPLLKLLHKLRHELDWVAW